MFLKMLSYCILSSPTAPRECFICGHLAKHECPQCLPDHKLQPGRIKQYCSTCNTQVSLKVLSKCQASHCQKHMGNFALCFLKVHSHPSRQGHCPKALTVAEHLAADAPVPRHMMELFAVLCIQTSHYVCFVKYGPDPKSWLFFDSMADRRGKTSLLFMFILCGVFFLTWGRRIQYLLLRITIVFVQALDMHGCLIFW